MHEVMRTRNGAATAYSPSLARKHLDALNKGQAELLAALGCMRGATDEPTPDPIALCRARWNVSRANRNHRSVVASILTELMINAAPGDLASIICLQRAGVQQTQRSTNHIQEWTPERVMTKWRDFCDASSKIQADLERRVQDEIIVINRMLRERSLIRDQAWWES